jgi:hypothetical protein
MRFFIEGDCGKCGPLTRISIKVILDAGIFKCCHVVCQECGRHNQIWFSQKEIQQVFNKRVKEGKSEDETPPYPRKPRRK